MAKFKIKNRQKRRYVKKQSPDLAFYTSVPLLVGFLPAMIVAIAFIIVPFITFKQLHPGLLQMLAHFLSRITVAFGQLFTFLNQTRTTIHFSKLPRISIAFPQISFNFSPVINLFLQSFFTLQRFLLASLQTVPSGFIRIVFALKPLSAFIGTSSLTVGHWVTTRIVFLSDTGWNGVMSIIAVTGNSLINLFIFLQQTIVIIFSKMLQAIVFVSKYFGTLLVTSIGFIGEVIVYINDFFIHAFTFLSSAIQQFLSMVINGALALLQMLVTAIIMVCTFVYSIIFAIALFFIHVVESPFIQLGKLLDALQPYILAVLKVCMRAWNELQNSFATTITLSEELVKNFPKK